MNIDIVALTSCFSRLSRRKSNQIDFVPIVVNCYTEAPCVGMEPVKPVKRTLRVMTLDERLNIIQLHAAGRKVMEISRTLHVPQSTISTIIKNKEAWLKKKDSVHGLSNRKTTSARNPKLESCMEVFIRQARAQNVPLSGATIRAKAKAFAAKLGIVNFKASSGWLTRFAKRQKLSYKQICGESAAVDTGITNDWMFKALPRLIAGYEPKDIFNADETGFFFKCLPDKTFTFQSEPCHGGKHSKQRITVMCATNMDGTQKLPLLVVGKSRKPRCFKNVRQLPVEYEANTKAWMTSELFELWLRKLDRQFSDENRKVLLLVDNCTAHTRSVPLKSINLQFFPPNATSVVQPLDLGIIKNLKHFYRGALVQRMLHDIEHRKQQSDVTLLDAIQMLAKAWSEDVKPVTIRNCFRKGGFVFHDEVEANELVSSNDEFGLGDSEQAMESMHADASFAMYCVVDKHLATTAVLTDSEILKTVQPDSDDSDSSDVHAGFSAVDVNNNLETLHAILKATASVPAVAFEQFNAIQNVLSERYGLRNHRC